MEIRHPLDANCHMPMNRSLLYPVFCELLFKWCLALQKLEGYEMKIQLAKPKHKQEKDVQWVGGVSTGGDSQWIY